MTLNTIFYDHVYEEMVTSVDDYRDTVPDADDTFATADPLKQQVEPIPTPEEFHHPSYIRWQMFDEIPQRLYTIQCEGYIDNKGKPLNDETLIKHFTSSEPPVNIDDELELCDDKYDLCKITKQIRTKKFICEAPIGSGKSTAILYFWVQSNLSFGISSEVEF